LQLGGEESSVVMFVISRRALDGLMHNSSFSLKASGGMSLVDFNTATQQQLAGADIVMWSKSKGAYGGLSLSGSDIAQRPDIDRSYYGTPVTAAQIATGDQYASRCPSPRARQLDRTLPAILASI
jgi:lipid-binding SYLF domain-containing protein